MRGRVYTHDLQIIKQPCQQFCLILRPKTTQTCNGSTKELLLSGSGKTVFSPLLIIHSPLGVMSQNILFFYTTVQESANYLNWQFFLLPYARRDKKQLDVVIWS